MSLALGLATMVSAQLNYQENFATADGTLPSVGWLPTGNFSAAGFFGTYSYTLTNAVTMQPIDGQTAVYMGSGDAVNEGLYTTDALSSQSGFTNISFAGGSLTFGIYDQLDGGNSTNETAWFMVQDGGNWYASANSIPGPSHTGTLMDPQTMTLSSNKADWVTVSGLGTPGIARGTTPRSDLGAIVTGAGIMFHLNNTYYDTFNYADFTISGGILLTNTIPSLSIVPSDDRLVILWPSFATNFVLQQNPDLTTTDWSTNSLAISNDETDNSVSIIHAAGSLFFRLSSQSGRSSLESSLHGIAAYYLADITNAPFVGATWAYDWQADFPSLPSGIEYVPMVWTYNNQSLSTMSNMVAHYKSNGANEVLAFNEPDNAGQANLTVSEALAGYGDLCQGPLPVISPAAADDTDSWMQQFMSGAASAGYSIPIVAVHHYGTNAVEFLSYIDMVYGLYGKPLWITEFADTDEPYIDWAPTNFTSVGVDDCVAFINAVLPGLEIRPYVVRYSWYCPATGSSSPSSQGLGTAALWNSDKTLTEVGAAYKNPGTAFTPAGYTWRLVNRATVNCLDNLGQTLNGNSVYQYAQVYSTNQTQRWTIMASGPHYKLQCVSGGLCLDTLGNTASGSLVGQESSSSSSNQLWNITPAGSGCFKITSVASGLCLDTLGYTTNGAAVGQRSISGSNNQKWMLTGY